MLSSQHWLPFQYLTHFKIAEIIYGIILKSLTNDAKSQFKCKLTSLMDAFDSHLAQYDCKIHQQTDGL